MTTEQAEEILEIMCEVSESVIADHECEQSDYSGMEKVRLKGEIPKRLVKLFERRCPCCGKPLDSHFVE